MKLSTTDLKTYRDDGYLFYDHRILDDDEIASILGEIDRIISGEIQFPKYLTQLEDHANLEKAEATKGNPIRKLQCLSYFLPFFEKLAKDPRIVDPVESILGPDIKLYTDEYFCKNPVRNGKAFNPYPWHQDAGGYTFFAPLDKVVTCWIALDPATPENGCMQFIPSSHVFGSIAKEYRSRFLAHPVMNQDKPVYAPRNPGCAVLHHGLNFHCSDPNRSNKPRRAIAFHYVSADTYYTGIENEETRRVTQAGDMSKDFRFMLIRGREHENCV